MAQRLVFLRFKCKHSPSATNVCNNVLLQQRPATMSAAPLPVQVFPGVAIAAVLGHVSCLGESGHQASLLRFLVPALPFIVSCLGENGFPLPFFVLSTAFVNAVFLRSTPVQTHAKDSVDSGCAVLNSVRGWLAGVLPGNRRQER